MCIQSVGECAYPGCHRREAAGGIKRCRAFMHEQERFGWLAQCFSSDNRKAHCGSLRQITPGIVWFCQAHRERLRQQAATGETPTMTYSSSLSSNLSIQSSLSRGQGQYDDHLQQQQQQPYSGPRSTPPNHSAPDFRERRPSQSRPKVERQPMPVLHADVQPRTPSRRPDRERSVDSSESDSSGRVAASRSKGDTTTTTTSAVNKWRAYRDLYEPQGPPAAFRLPPTPPSSRKSNQGKSSSPSSSNDWGSSRGSSSSSRSSRSSRSRSSSGSASTSGKKQMASHAAGQRQPRRKRSRSLPTQAQQEASADAAPGADSDARRRRMHRDATEQYWRTLGRAYESAGAPHRRRRSASASSASRGVGVGVRGGGGDGGPSPDPLRLEMTRFIADSDCPALQHAVALSVQQTEMQAREMADMQRRINAMVAEDRRAETRRAAAAAEEEEEEGEEPPFYVVEAGIVSPLMPVPLTPERVRRPKWFDEEEPDQSTAVEYVPFVPGAGRQQPEPRREQQQQEQAKPQEQAKSQPGKGDHPKQPRKSRFREHLSEEDLQSVSVLKRTVLTVPGAAAMRSQQQQLGGGSGDRPWPLSATAATTPAAATDSRFMRAPASASAVSNTNFDGILRGVPQLPPTPKGRPRDRSKASAALGRVKGLLGREAKAKATASPDFVCRDAAKVEREG